MILIALEFLGSFWCSRKYVLTHSEMGLFSSKKPNKELAKSRIPTYIVLISLGGSFDFLRSLIYG